MRASVITRALLLSIAVLVVGHAAEAAGGLSTRLYAYDGHEVSWVRGIGFPDGSKANYGLRFEKVDATADKWAGAAIGDFEVPVSTLGFTLNGDCDAGLWFYVRTVDGHANDLSCDQATTKEPVVSADGTVWLRVRFDVPALQAEVIHLRYSPQLRADVAVVDDIAVNDESAGKPGKN